MPGWREACRPRFPLAGPGRAAESDAFREERAPRRLSSGELAARLPEGVVMVDLLAYDHVLRRARGAAGRTKWEKRYAAFFVRPGAEAARVDLGAATGIDALVGEWRAEARDGGGNRGLGSKSATTAGSSGHLPPLYWAGFTISGDWR